MRIAFLSIGRHLHTERWIQWFARRGDECHLLTVQPGSLEGAEVHDIRRGGPFKPWRYWRSLGLVRRLLEEIRPDVLNTHFLTGYGYWGAFSGFRPNVLTVWGDDVYVTPHENPLKNWLARHALARADYVTGDSADILRGCVELGADSQRCFEVLWGVDLQQAFHPERPQDVRRRLDIPAEAPLLFSPRSFTQAYYNIDVIIDAAVRVQAQRPDTHIVFAGYEGDPGPFQARAAAAGLERGVHFVGRIPHEEFGAYLVASDVFISVPSVDATAVSLLEAMACGTAVVVSDLPSSTEWVEDGRSGRVVSARDEDALTDALLELVDDRVLRERLGREARAVAERYADFDTNMRRVAALFEVCLGSASLPADMHPMRLRED